MGDREDYDDDEDVDNGGYWNEEEKDEEDLQPDRTRDGQFDYLNDDGIVVPKDTVY